MVDWLINSGWQGMWKEAVVTSFKTITSKFAADTRIKGEKKKISDAEIWTEKPQERQKDVRCEWSELQVGQAITVNRLSRCCIAKYTLRYCHELLEVKAIQILKYLTTCMNN